MLIHCAYNLTATQLGKMGLEGAVAPLTGLVTTVFTVLGLGSLRYGARHAKTNEGQRLCWIASSYLMLEVASIVATIIANALRSARKALQKRKGSGSSTLFLAICGGTMRFISLITTIASLLGLVHLVFASFGAGVSMAYKGLTPGPALATATPRPTIN